MLSVYTNHKTGIGDADPLFSVYTLFVEQNIGKLQISVKAPPSSLFDFTSVEIFKQSAEIGPNIDINPFPPPLSVDPQLTPD